MATCFLSYARGDDEPFVERLRTRLRECGIDVWWDREAMRSSGVHFLQEIQDGIRSRAWFVLVSGPAAACSDYVAHEIDVARTTCMPTVLVLRAGDREDVPSRFRHHHQFDLRVEETGRDFEGLVRTLQGEVPTVGRMLGALPGAPAHLLRRDADLDLVVRDALAGVTDPLAISTLSAASSVNGMAGAGKTVLAALAARDCRIRHHFPGGVVFVRLGPDSTAESAAQDIRRALRRGGAIGDTARTGSGDAIEALRDAAQADKRFFVLDDVWEVEQLSPIMGAVAGTPSRILLTTRRTDLGRGVGVVHHRLELLDPSTAHRFLLQWSGSDTTQQLPDGLAEVARACGYLPLGLAVAGFLVGDGLTWPDLATQLRDADLRALDADLGVYERTGVYAAIDVSARRLESQRPELWSRYLDLALFAAAVPRSVVARHWAVPSVGAVRLDLQHLIRRSLLTDADDDSVALHDLQRSYLLNRGADPGALARRLVDTLGRPPDDWTDQARSDPWLRQNLMSLLCTAKYDTQLLALQRRASDASTAPAWFELRRDRGELHEYWVDLERVDQHHRGRLPEPELLGGVIERAAVRATLRSFSRRPPELTLAAVRAGALSPLAAWQQAGQMPRGQARVEALAHLASLLSTRDEQITAALAALDELSALNTRDREEVVVRLIEQFPEPAVVDRVLYSVDENNGISYRVLIALAPHLNDEQREFARSVAERLDECERRVALAGLTIGTDRAEVDETMLGLSVELDAEEAIAVLIYAGDTDTELLQPWLAPLVDAYPESLLQFPQLWRVLPPEQVAHFLAAQRDLGDLLATPLDIARSLSEIVARHPQLSSAALRLARQLSPSYTTISVVGAAASVSDTDARPGLVAEVIERINGEIESGSNDWMADEMKQAFAVIPVEVALRLGGLAEQIAPAERRCRAIAALVQGMPTDHARQIVRRELRRLDGDIDGNEVRRALAALAPVIGNDDVADALLVADGPRDNGFDTAFLPMLASELDEPRRSEVYTWSLSTYLPGESNAARPGWALSALIEQTLDLDASPAMITMAEELIATIDDPSHRVGPLAVLARVAPAATAWSRLQSALAVIDEPWEQARATARAARLGPAAKQTELVGRCLELVEPVHPSDQDTNLVQDLLRTGDERAIQLARRLLDSSWKDRFGELYAELPLAALETWNPMGGLFRKADLLYVSYAVRLAEVGQEAEAVAALRRAGSIAQNDGLRRIAPVLSRLTVEELLSASPLPGEWALAALCERLAELGDLPTALQIVRRDVGNPGWRLPALAACAAVDARTGQTDLLDDVLDDLATISEQKHTDVWKSLEKLSMAVAALPARLRSDRLSRAIEIASSQSRRQAIPTLWVLAPAYSAVAGPDGAWEAFNAVRRVLEWWPSQHHLAAHRDE